MAVAVTMDFPGGTLEQYDEVLVKMGLTPKGKGPPGALFHWATLAPTGLKVTDVWESRQQFDDFAAEQIGPFSAEVGLPGPPEMTFYEVHSYFTSGS